MRLNTIKSPLYFLLGALVFFSACQPEEVTDGNGLSDSNVDASFTIESVSGEPNRFVLSANRENVLKFLWNTGDGFYEGAATEELFLPDAGTYSITHQAYGRGGIINETSQDVIVATSDPVAGNLIKGGSFQTQADHDEWTILQISDSGTYWTFNEGSANVVGSGYNQQGIYQAIEVEANKDYTVDMKVFGSGATNTWFEVYVSSTPPVQNQDYSAEGRRMGLSTWDGCANGPFEGKLSNVGCVGSGNTVNFSEDGTVYLVIKSGGENMGSTGISITNVEFRGSVN
ncbi:hypothetical protein [Leeuwenhoekiella sp. ZYFB001]|uniref:hypothetical protein n=1 Tax=Leeuwenhoekiella sp. ZYFB001 TaxID=2719912 RepID=UPI00142F7137|nr:hypothetical protein [Leeuwenhoekiella sp. ZYFB001]|tara:strand:+ start:5284 stop:6141 length:858 start_codon:yes stop_codon:yes gene_type:complete